MNLGNLLAVLFIIPLVVGVVIGTMGYKLWKYTIFFIGFLQGAALGVALAALTDTAMQCGDTPRCIQGGDGANIALYAFFPLLLGCMGGACLLACYFLVIFCSGCQCGMGTFVMVFVPLAAYNSPRFLATDAGHETLVAGCLVFGVLGGILFIKLQKLFIIIGTSFLGAGLVCLPGYLMRAALYDGYEGDGGEVTVEFVQLAIFVGFFCIQWFKTSKGVEIDPHTGEVTVIIVQQPMQPTMQAPLLVQPPAQIQQQPQYQLPYQPLDADQAGAPVGQGMRLSMNTSFMARHIPQAQPQEAVVVEVVDSRPPPTSSVGTLDEFVSTNRLEQFKPAMMELGVIEAEELADVTDDELRSMGLSLIQLKRLRRQIPQQQQQQQQQPSATGKQQPGGVE